METKIIVGIILLIIAGLSTWAVISDIKEKNIWLALVSSFVLAASLTAFISFILC